MIIMSFFKVIFLLLLCVPIVCLMIYLLVKLIDEVLKQNRKPGRRKQNSDGRHVR